MLNEVFLIQSLILIILSYFLLTTHILTLWYLSGLYMILTGFFLLIDHANIFIGFLWVIDLGVGLIFFIFILNLTKFLHQKNFSNLFIKNFFFFFFLFFFLIFFFFLFSNSFDNSNYSLKKNWFFLISWYDYYSIFFTRTVSDLTLLRELYFYNNSFEFFLINFMLFYGIIITIFLTFLIKKICLFFNFSQFKNFNLIKENLSVLFIRNQNFIRQQNTSTGTRVWKKFNKHSF